MSILIFQGLDNTASPAYCEASPLLTKKWVHKGRPTMPGFSWSWPHAQKRVLVLQLDGQFRENITHEALEQLDREFNQRRTDEHGRFIIDIRCSWTGDTMVFVGFIIAFVARIRNDCQDIDVALIVPDARLLQRLTHLGIQSVCFVAASTALLPALAVALRKRQTIRRREIEHHLFILKGHREFRRRSTIDSVSLQCDATSAAARYSRLDAMDRWLGRRLKAWGFNDTDWNNNLRSAVLELLTNVVAYAPKGPRGGVTTKMHLCSFTHHDGTWDYVTCMIGNTSGEPPIPVGKLRSRGFHLGTHGRGTDIVKGFADLFAVVRDTDGVVIMKKRRHAAVLTSEVKV